MPTGSPTPGADVQARDYPYGSHPSQFVRLHLPAGGDRLPVAVVIHGGFWRQRYGIELADPLCADLAARGVAAAAVEYRRVDRTLRDGSRSRPTPRARPAVVGR